MSEYYNVVPWYNSQEWLGVYEKLCTHNASTETKKEALNVMLLWKVRCPSLPSGIESTLSLLNVYLEDLRTIDDNLRQEITIRLAYSTSLMRFVNHMLDNETIKGASLYKAAKNLDVPDWIINLRHDAAHSNNLPSLNLLREAVSVSLEWLKTNYWDRHKEIISDFIINSENNVNNNDNVYNNSKIISVLNFCISLGICNQSKIKSLSKIPDEAMRESMVCDIQDVFGSSVDLSNQDSVLITNLIDLVNRKTRDLMKSSYAIEYVKKNLLGEDTLILSKELAEEIGGMKMLEKRILSKGYVQCFEILIKYLHSNDLLLDFIVGLINITETEQDGEKCMLAALWLPEILKSFLKLSNFLDRLSMTEFPDQSNVKNMTHLYYHWFPSEKKNLLLLDLTKPVPYQLTELDFVQKIISKYNAYLTYFINDLLNLLKPSLSKSTVQNLCSLANMVACPDKYPIRVNKIYTLDDIKMDESMKEDSDSDCVEIIDDNHIEDETYSTSSGSWKKATVNINWSKMPIGFIINGTETMDIVE